ncbi:jg21651 [Pararge aegeria aegeria]|uniref:Jg21651 protein n=1 Tax=Pararge aegeria aegeria TaxID=348720 RepID=A0A8S4RKH2_9NEOP|nr:jg21651 [Pararge aegeria aegeria]
MVSGKPPSAKFCPVSKNTKSRCEISCACDDTDTQALQTGTQHRNNAAVAAEMKLGGTTSPDELSQKASTATYQISNKVKLKKRVRVCTRVYMGVDNDLHPLEKRIEENEYGEK